MTGAVDTLRGFGIKAGFGYVLNHIALFLRQLSKVYQELGHLNILSIT